MSRVKTTNISIYTIIITKYILIIKQTDLQFNKIGFGILY